MNHTFSRVAAFCGLRLSYYITAALLAPAFVVLALTGYRSATPLYILLAMAVSPSVIEAIFFSKRQSKERKRITISSLLQKIPL